MPPKMVQEDNMKTLFAHRGMSALAPEILLPPLNCVLNTVFTGWNVTWTSWQMARLC